ncbi:hypothetical protein GcM3_128011 [Golovinomyces cichoracearum]|uniref:Uncharacterized protein n=1 Tax=Golovinomyces cichoracearum TaxID=62708 RepID=A0A420I5A7_9PEZI|nr:hypothetical protein GcM3_128011 [Golovinomyces cichoracearum]
MYTTSFIVLILTTLAEARFGQENGNGAIEKITALGDLGKPGQAATLAGGSIGLLLAAANPCKKLEKADEIVEDLGDSERVIEAARGLAAAEINFNPFATSVPNICAEPSLPKTEALRGVVPLIDPAVVSNEIENKNSAESVKTPFDAKGLSQADVMVAHGFSNFTAVKLDGTKVDSKSLDVAKTNGGATSSSNSSAASSKDNEENENDSKNSSAASTSGAVEANKDSGKSAQDADKSSAIDDPVIGKFDGFKPSSIEGLDFGKCVPTMKFEPGLNGRKETELTFQAADPIVNKGQQEALNPNIITNRITDQLTNSCGANQAAKDAAVEAMTLIASLNKKDASVAETWNTKLGFDGVDLNPDEAPRPGLVGHA